ncbi:Dcp1p-Dcp2p decapping enzyme complex alpha subunit [Coemansia sp. RSA 552]|nr:Dcp1p-Dcp2p decapping enzyme complex alpha subunit [Coemansia sp. RSA 552]
MAGEIPEIPGYLVTDKTAAYELRRLVGALAGTNRTTFPGAQPVSFTRTQSLRQLLDANYFVCEKSDGVRVLVLMLVTPQGPATYLITRKSEYYLAPNAHFPVPTTDAQFHHNTLIDAELVIDVDQGRHVRKLLAFDALVVNGTSCMARPLEKRLGYLAEHIVKPYARWSAQNPQAQRPFAAEMKSFQRSYGTPMVFHEIIPRLLHQNDGLIYTSADAPYTPGTCNQIIKWKPAHENSIDFKLRPRNGAIDLLVWEGEARYQPFGQLAVQQADWQLLGDPAQLDGRIAECVFDPGHAPPSRWRFLRFRDDKPHGNHSSVVTRIMESISDSMSQAELEDAMPEIRANWKRRNHEA